MNVRRLFLAVLFAVGLLAVPTSGAQAASPCPPGQPPGIPPGSIPPGPPTGRPPQYPPGQCQLRLSAAAVAAGASVTAAGSGYFTNSGVSLDLGSTHLASVTTDGSGAFQVALTIPASTAAGSYELTATGQDAGGTRVLSATLAVTAPVSQRASTGSSGGFLPHTGADIAGYIVLALALISGGFALMRSARRRRATAG